MKFKKKFELLAGEGWVLLKNLGISCLCKDRAGLGDDKSLE